MILFEYKMILEDKKEKRSKKKGIIVAGEIKQIHKGHKE